MTDTLQLIYHFFVKIKGADAPIELMNALVSIKVESSLHLPDVATITLDDTRLQWIDDDRLAPGTLIEVFAQGNGEGKLIFNGEIVEIEPDFSPAMQQITVRAFDRLHRLARGRKVRSFQNATDGDIVQKLAGEAGLQTQVGETREVYDYILQANETDLDFLRRRAFLLGYLLYVRKETLHFDAPDASGSTIELKWGENLTAFHPRMTTIEQINEVTVRGWNPAEKQAIIGQARDGRGSPSVGEERSGGELAESAFQRPATYLVTHRPIRTQSLADQIAQATADRLATRFIEADGACSGNPDITAGVFVQLSSVGRRFGGTYFVTGATHIYTAREGYMTEFSISGLHPATLLHALLPDQAENEDPGLVIGIVTDNQDPDGLGRVKVKFPWLSEEHASNWARVVAAGVGADRGIQFLPEVNDEVLIGFEQGDIHYPYVLGGLWNGQDAPPESGSQNIGGDGKVQRRIVRSRTGHTITLDDSDSGGGITIEDKQGNIIKLDSQSNAVTIEVKGNATLQAGGNLTVEARGNLTLQAQGTVDVKGTIINLN